MLSMGQMLAVLRQLEIQVGSGLYQAKLESNVSKALGVALSTLQEVQDTLEDLTDN